MFWGFLVLTRSVRRPQEKRFRWKLLIIWTVRLSPQTAHRETRHQEYLSFEPLLYFTHLIIFRWTVLTNIHAVGGSYIKHEYPDDRGRYIFTFFIRSKNGSRIVYFGGLLLNAPVEYTRFFRFDHDLGHVDGKMVGLQLSPRRFLENYVVDMTNIENNFISTFIILSNPPPTRNILFMLVPRLFYDFWTTGAHTGGY